MALIADFVISLALVFLALAAFGLLIFIVAGFFIIPAFRDEELKAENEKRKKSLEELKANLEDFKQKTEGHESEQKNNF